MLALAPLVPPLPSPKPRSWIFALGYVPLSLRTCPALAFVPCPYTRLATTLGFVPCPQTCALLQALLTALKCHAPILALCFASVSLWHYRPVLLTLCNVPGPPWPTHALVSPVLQSPQPSSRSFLAHTTTLPLLVQPDKPQHTNAPRLYWLATRVQKPRCLLGASAAAGFDLQICLRCTLLYLKHSLNMCLFNRVPRPRTCRDFQCHR